MIYSMVSEWDLVPEAIDAISIVRQREANYFSYQIYLRSGLVLTQGGYDKQILEEERKGLVMRVAHI